MSSMRRCRAEACAVLVSSNDTACGKEDMLPLFAAVEALRGEVGASPTSIEIKDGVLHITLSDDSVLTTDGSKLVTADYVDNAVKPYICQSFNERTLWSVLSGNTAVISKEDMDAILYSPKGVRVLFRDDFGLPTGMVIGYSAYFFEGLVLMIGFTIYFMDVSGDVDAQVMTSGKAVDMSRLATQKEIEALSNKIEDIETGHFTWVEAQ